MRKTMKGLCLILCFTCMLCFLPHVYSNAPYTISDYQIHAEVDKSAVMNVEERIQIKDCDNLTFTKEILQDYYYDANQDGTMETYAYEISDIKVEGASYSTSHEDGKHRIELTLKEPNAHVILYYQVRLRKYDIQDANLFLYQLISPNHNGTIEQFSASITFANRPENAAFDVYISDDNQSQGTRLNAFLDNSDNKTLRIQSSQPLVAGEGIMVNAILRDFFFTYSHPLTLHLYFTIFSIIMVMGSYLVIIYGGRFSKHNILQECYPLTDIEIGSLGYILDGVIDESDIIAILIEWANQNYIQIRNENQTVALVLINELPANAKPYEKHLFDLIFTDYIMVTIEQLRSRHLRKQIKAIELEIQQYLEKDSGKPIFANTSYLWQLSAALAICIPLGLSMFACIYSEDYAFMHACLYALATIAIIYANLIPWVWIIKHRYRLPKNSQDVYRILTMLINFVCGGLLYQYLLEHQTPVVYIAINFVLTVLFACILIFMERRTAYGKHQQRRLLSLQQFIRTVSSEHLTHFLLDNPYYFEDMLPYAYVFDITDIWGKKFSSIPLQAPLWYFHVNADAGSTIYWMRSLDTSLDLIKKALYYDTKTKLPKKKGK